MIEIFSFYAVLLLLALVVEPLAERVRIPFGAVLVLLGFAGSEILVAVGGDTGLRWELFHDLIFFIFLPVLIYEAAFNLDVAELRRNLTLILALALPLMLLATGITAAVLYYGIGYPAAFPWLTALIAGALLSATDPVAVLALFKSAGAPERLRTLIDGESLFNDATAIVLVTLLVAMAAAEGESIGVPAGILKFLTIFFGGLAAGLVVGVAARGIHRFLEAPVARGVLSLVSAYGAFLLAEHFHTSGVMATLVAGLLLGQAERQPGNEASLRALHHLWEYKAWLANALLFLISGISFQLAMFSDQWLAMLIGIAAVLAARAFSVFFGLPLIERLPGTTPLPRGWRPVIWWGGLRGAVTLALALSLPVTLESWWTVQSIAYGVVLWTLLVQAATMPWLMRRSGV